MAGLLLAELFTDIVVNDLAFRAAIKTDKGLLQGLRDRLESVSISAAKLSLSLNVIGIFFIKLASDAEESGAKFVAVFKEETAAARLFAKVVAGETQRSVTDIKRSLAGLQDTFVPLGFARKEARLLSQQMVKLAIDVGSFNNVASDDVVRDFSSALVGNTETVRKYGIIITQVTLAQELLRLGMADSVATATEQQKVQARLNLIMAGSTDAIGDAIRTGDSFANTLQGMFANIKELGISIGEVLLPPAKELISFIKNVIPPITAWIKRNKEWLTTTVKMASILLTLVAVASTVLTVFLAVTVAVINLTIAWAVQAVVLTAFSLALGKGVTGLSLFRLALVSTTKLVWLLKVPLALVAVTVVATTSAWASWTERLADHKSNIRARNETDRLSASIKALQLRLRDGGIQKAERKSVADEQARRDAIIRKVAREKARIEREKDRAATFRVTTATFQTSRALLEADFALKLLSTQEFIVEKRALIEKEAALSLRILTVELGQEITTIKENEKKKLITAEEAAIKLGAVEREKQTRQLILVEETARKRVALEVETVRLIETETRKRDRAEEQRRRDKLRAIKTEERERIAAIRRLQKILIQDQRKIQKERREEVAGVRGKFKEAQQRARETQISFSGLTERLRSLQIALGGGKENKVVTELKRQLKISEMALKKQDAILEAIKDQPATVGA